MKTIMDKAYQQKGTVVVTVLILVAVATYLAVEITHRQRIDINRTATLLSLEQSSEYSKSADVLAQYILNLDLELNLGGGGRSQPIDTLNDEWATPRNFPVGRGSIGGEIVDLQGRFNLNSLALIEPIDVEAEPKAVPPVVGITHIYPKHIFIELLGNLSIPDPSDPDYDPSVTEEDLADRIKDWVDDNSTPLADGAEEDVYLGKVPAYGAGDRLLLDVSELILVEGITKHNVEKLSDFVAFLPANAPINLNTAPAEVRAAFEIGCLDPAEVSSALNSADGITSSNLANIESPGGNALRLPACDETYVYPFSANSQFFLLKATADVDGRRTRTQTVLFREDVTDAGDVDTKVILRTLLPPF